MLISAEDLVKVDASRAGVTANPLAYCSRSVVIDLAGELCAIHFSSAEVAACFEARYADLTRAGGIPARQAFVVHDPQLGWLFWSSADLVLQWPHGDIPIAVVAFLADAVALTMFFQDRADGMVSLHAATVGIPGGIAAIVGDSNVGKTTTAIACARAGMALYSDERCLVDRQSFVHAFPRAINVRAPGLRLLQNDVVPGADPIGAQLRARGAGDWNDVRISDIAPWQGSLAPRPLSAVFLLAGTAPAPILEPATAGRAAKASARWAQGAGANLDKLSRLFELFSPVRCYRLRLGTPDATARLIRSVLEAHVLELECIA